MLGFFINQFFNEAILSKIVFSLLSLSFHHSFSVSFIGDNFHAILMQRSISPVNEWKFNSFRICYLNISYMKFIKKIMFSSPARYF